MSLAEYVSRPFPLFAKLTVMLRKLLALPIGLPRFARQVRGVEDDRDLTDSRLIEPVQEIVERRALDVEIDVNVEVGVDVNAEGDGRVDDDVNIDGPVDDDIAVLQMSDTPDVAEPACDPSEREHLIRRRWAETGIKMWHPDAAGGAVLNIQGRTGLLPVLPGERLPRYDKLEFRQVGERIICEGVAVDPPRRRTLGTHNLNARFTAAR